MFVRSTRSACLVTCSTRLSTLSICLFMHLSTRSTRLSVRSACLSIRSTRLAIRLPTRITRSTLYVSLLIFDHVYV